MTSACANCDSPLVEGHRFCRACGTRAEPARQPPPTADPATDGCPSCGRAATPGERFCRTCGGALTADAGAARPSRALPSPEPRSAQPPPRPATRPRKASAAPTQRIAPASAPGYAPPALDPRAGSGRSKRLQTALLAALGLAVLAGGVFAGLTLLGSDEEPKPSASSGGNDGGEAKPEGETLLPELSPTEMTRQIRQLLVEYHQGIVDDDLDASFELLTERKKRAALRRFGYDGWKAGQATLAPHIQPSGLHAAIDYADPLTGVVRVRVSGMGYTNPRSSCSTWSGITWVRYERDAFHYDPGYQTTPQRTRDWKDRQSELLGIGC